MSSIFFSGGMCSRITSQSKMSNDSISFSVKRPTILWALLNFSISLTKTFIGSFVSLLFLI